MHRNVASGSGSLGRCLIDAFLEAGDRVWSRSRTVWGKVSDPHDELLKQGHAAWVTGVVLCVDGGFTIA